MSYVPSFQFLLLLNVHFQSVYILCFGGRYIDSTLILILVKLINSGMSVYWLLPITSYYHKAINLNHTVNTSETGSYVEILSVVDFFTFYIFCRLAIRRVKQFSCVKPMWPSDWLLIVCSTSNYLNLLTFLLSIKIIWVFADI